MPTDNHEASLISGWMYPIFAAVGFYWLIRFAALGGTTSTPATKDTERDSTGRCKDWHPGAYHILRAWASGIAKFAVIWAASKGASVRVVAIASRDRARARAYAEKHNIPRYYDNYQKLLDDPDVDAVYVGLPTSYHYMWSAKAIEAGKHVLVEKPLTVNYKEAKDLQKLLSQPSKSPRAPLIVLEGYHYRFHPVARHIKALVSDKEFMGDLKEIQMDFSLLDPKACLKNYLGIGDGGGDEKFLKIKLLDRWCYAVDTLRFLLPQESKLEVKDASISTFRASAKFNARYQGNSVVASYVVEKGKIEGITWNIRIEGSNHTVLVSNIGHPYIYHSISIRPSNDPTKTRTFKMYGEGETTFEHQLEAFSAAIRAREPKGVPGRIKAFSAAIRAREPKGVPGRIKNVKRGVFGDYEIWSGIDSAVQNMRVIDEVFKKAGTTSIPSRSY
ncbi:hypothetical protein AAMO2058_001670100 [Amorphochlora amoebiformis]